jgi:WD40 repeat protein
MVTNSNLPAELGRFHISANGKTGAVVHKSEVVVFDPQQHANRFVLPAEVLYQELRLSPNGHYLAALTAHTNQLHLWDVIGRKRLPGFSSAAVGPYFEFSRNGEWLVTSSTKGFEFWKVGTWTRSLTIPGAGNQPGPMAFSPDGKLVTIVTSPGTIELLEFPSANRLARLFSPDQKPLRALTFSPDGRQVAAASSDQLIMLWDLARLTGELTRLNLRGELPTFSPAPVHSRPVQLDLSPGALPTE